MKAMKKSVAILLAVCMIVPMFVLAAFTASANEDPWSTGTVEDPTGTAPPQEQQTTTITVGVISYLTEELESSGWQVHYWGGADGAADSDLTATGETKQKKLGSDYWGDEAQTFNIYTAEIPADATGFKVHNGDRWFGEDGSLDKPVAFVFNYAEYDGDPNADRAVYECEDGFYIVGSFNTWAVQKSYKLEQKDPDDDSVFVLKNVTLKKNAELKVVSFSMFDGITGYYPGDGYGNYIVGDTGNYDVLFNKDGSVEGWYGGYVNLDYKPIVYNTLQVDGGDIAVNFYFALTEDQVSVEPTYIFCVNDKSTDELHITANNLAGSYNDSLNLYKTTCNVAPAEMTDEIDVSFTLDGDGDQNAQWYGFGGYSAKDCAMSYYNGNYEGDINVRVKNLAIAMLNYGAACQTQFNHYADEPANADLDEDDQNTSVLDDSEKAWFVNVEVPDKADINADESVQAYGVEYKGLTLFVQSKTTLRFYFEVKDTEKYNDTTKGKISIDTETEKTYEGNTKYVYVDLTDIGAPYLGVTQRLFVNDASFGPYSALSYVKAALSEGSGADDTLKSTVSTLYRYHLAAAGLNDQA